MNKKTYGVGLMLGLLWAWSAHAAINLDRTRVILDGHSASVSMLVVNDVHQPHLLQAWVEDDAGEKMTGPLLALPPLQRIEGKQKKLIQVMRVTQDGLAQDQESLFYLNLLEVPPKSDSENTLHIAFQSRLKLFYRPKGITRQATTPRQTEMRVSVAGTTITFANPTPLHTVIVFLGDSGQQEYPHFTELLLKPFSSTTFEAPSAVTDTLYLSYMDDSGASKQLIYHCGQSRCQLTEPQKESS